MRPRPSCPLSLKAILGAVSVVAVLAPACGGSDSARYDTSTPTSAPAAVAPLALTSSAFADGAAIPKQYTCDGEGGSPPLAWNGLPAGTAAVALIVFDPDAPGSGFDHWVVFDMPPSVASLGPGIQPGAALPSGGVQGANGGGRTAYAGPCPPPGPPHHYRFTLYASDRTIGLASGASRREVEAALQGHILAQTLLTGLYQR